MIKHRWELSSKTSPSGKMMYHCPVCGLYDSAPVKEEVEDRECIKGKYRDGFRIEDNKVYARF